MRKTHTSEIQEELPSMRGIFDFFVQQNIWLKYQIKSRLFCRSIPFKSSNETNFLC